MGTTVGSSEAKVVNSWIARAEYDDLHAVAQQLAIALNGCLIDSAYVAAMVKAPRGDLAYKHAESAEDALNAARKAGLIP